MSIRIQFSTKVDSVLLEKLKQLSDKTRIPQTKLIDEAIELLLKKHGE